MRNQPLDSVARVPPQVQLLVETVEEEPLGFQLDGSFFATLTKIKPKGMKQGVSLVCLCHAARDGKLLRLDDTEYEKLRLLRAHAAWAHADLETLEEMILRAPPEVDRNVLSDYVSKIVEWLRKPPRKDRPEHQVVSALIRLFAQRVTSSGVRVLEGLDTSGLSEQVRDQVRELFAPEESGVYQPPPVAKFILNKPVSVEETRYYEFKEVTGNNPVNIIKNAADVYTVAFLNSEGGRIYWGVTDDRIAVGVCLDSKQKDELQRVVGQKLHQIKPAIAPTAYRILFHPLYREDETIVPDLCIVEIVVPRVSATELYFTGGNEAFVKTDGAKKLLVGPELQAEILRRQTPHR